MKCRLPMAAIRPFLLFAFLALMAAQSGASPAGKPSLPELGAPSWMRLEELWEKSDRDFETSQTTITPAEEREFFLLRYLYQKYDLWDEPRGEIRDDRISFNRYEYRRFEEMDANQLTRPDWLLKKKRKLLEIYSKAYARMQMMIQVRDFLPSLVEAYASQDSTTAEISKKFLESLQTNIKDTTDLYGWKWGPLNPFPMYFTASLDGRFQVSGIEQDRLAVNSGSAVYINVNRLAEMEDLEIPKIVQLLLHEYTHLVDSVPLAERDAWSAKVREWVQNTSWKIRLKDGSVVHALAAPTGTLLPQTLSIRNFSGDQPHLQMHFQRQLRKSLLLIRETADAARPWLDLFDNFQTFENRTRVSMKNITPMNDVSYSYVAFPKIRITNLSADSLGRVILSYSQSSSYLGRDTGTQTYRPAGDFEGNGDALFPQIPDVQYKIEYSPDQDVTETRKVYSSELAAADFEIYRMVEKGSRRYISLRLKKSEELKTMGKNVFLIAKALGPNQQISIPVSQMRDLSPSEVLLHFEVPPRALEISQLLIPVIENNLVSAEKEITIRPRQKLQLQGPDTEPTSSLQVKLFDVAEKLPGNLSREKLSRMKADVEVHRLGLGAKGATAEDLRNLSPGRPAEFHLQLLDDRKIRGITLEVEHTVQNARIRWNVNVVRDFGSPGIHPQQTEADLVGTSAIGRKYYLSGRDLKIQQTGDQIDLKFDMPFDYLKKVEEGPRYKDKISWAYTFVGRMKAYSFWDTGYRKVAGAWIHFEDGSAEKIPVKDLPAYSFETFQPPPPSAVKPASPAKPTTPRAPRPVMSCLKAHSAR